MAKKGIGKENVRTGIEAKDPDQQATEEARDPEEERRVGPSAEKGPTSMWPVGAQLDGIADRSLSAT